MMAAMDTLVFLGTLWLLVVVGAAMLEESGGRIAAALKGLVGRPRVQFVPARVRTRACLQQPVRVRARWRAAA
jgi:hypothetical protein